MKFFKVEFFNPENINKINIFTPSFIEKNKYRIKIVYENKLFPLENKIINKYKGNEKLKIKIISFYNIQDNEIAEGFKTNNNCYETKRYIRNLNRYNRYSKHLKYLFQGMLKMVYKIETNQVKIKILGEQFVKNNENKGIILYKDKIYKFQEYFLIKDINKEDIIENKNLELLLGELDDIIDRSYMFEKCDSLIEFSFNKDKQHEVK